MDFRSLVLLSVCSFFLIYLSTARILLHIDYIKGNMKMKSFKLTITPKQYYKKALKPTFIIWGILMLIMWGLVMFTSSPR